MASVEIRDAGVTYEGVDRQVHALDALSLALADGEPVAIIGPSGCGKSTLLLAVAGLLRPTSGDVLVGGEPVSRPRLRTALILQDFGLLPWKTALHNAALGLEVRRVSRAESRRRAIEALDRVGLGEFAETYPAELSGGMRQRLALARAIALDADLLLMDEAVFLGRRIVVLTPRPGRVSAIVDNPGMGGEGYRDTEAFYERCAELRRLLSAEGAFSKAPR